ncbi:MAG: hypothetical protein Kow0068_12090 [Marinilabiliales bacterium]
MKIITDNSKIDFDNLEQFVYHHPHGNFFQSTKAYQFFHSVEKYEPILLVAIENTEIIGSLLAVIIREPGLKGYFSRRCIIWGGPLVKDDNPEIVHKLLEKLNEKVTAKAIYTEFRNLFDVSHFFKVFNDNGFTFIEHLNYIVPIANEDNAWTNLSSSKRRQIRKSFKNGAEIVEPTHIEQIKEFYAILNNLYQEKVKKPLPDFDFFEKFYQSPEMGKYFLIRHEKTIVGGIMCSIYKDTIYEWFICGKDGEKKNIYPSVLATWAPIEYAAKNGLKYFDFMGAGSAESDYGVRDFKSKFGGELVQYGRFLRINNKMLYNVGKLGLKLMRFLK